MVLLVVILFIGSNKKRGGKGLGIVEVYKFLNKRIKYFGLREGMTNEDIIKNKAVSDRIILTVLAPINQGDYLMCLEAVESNLDEYLALVLKERDFNKAKQYLVLVHYILKIIGGIEYRNWYFGFENVLYSDHGSVPYYGEDKTVVDEFRLYMLADYFKDPVNSIQYKEFLVDVKRSSETVEMLDEMIRIYDENKFKNCKGKSFKVYTDAVYMEMFA